MVFDVRKGKFLQSLNVRGYKQFSKEESCGVNKRVHGSTQQ